MSVIRLRWLMGVMCAYMVYVVIATSLQSNLFTELPRLSQDPWVVATLKDFYNNTLLIFIWVVYKESKWWSRLGWFLGFVILGSIATTAYVLVELLRLKPTDSIDKLLTRKN